MTNVRIGEINSIQKNRIINTSAGCYLVRKNNNKYELLMLHKKWPDGKEQYVLPKGHTEWDEVLEDTVRREITEESGYTDFKLLKYIGSCTYELDWSEIQLKTDHYYLGILQTEDKRERKPERYEEGVTVENLWIDLEEGFNLLTFENQKEIHSKVRELIPK